MSHTLIAGRYQIQSKLGAGGMGVVYKAHDRLTDTVVGLKQVLLQPKDLEFASRVSRGGDHRLALTHEFRTLARLRHPNIISVLDYGYDTLNQPFYVMEYIEDGRDIRDVAIEKDKVGKTHLLVDLLQGLAYLHRNHIIHRDLKPENIMVVNGSVKVLDFGLSVIRTEQTQGQDEESAGTIAYMAPELFLGTPASIASDLYAIGVITYELFVGRHPFNIDNATTLITDILQTVPDFPVDLSYDLIEVMDYLLEKSPDDRYQQSGEVIEALYHAIGEAIPPDKSIIQSSYLNAARFIGRKPELQTLESALEAMMQGSASAWLVGGESGIGKSRLLDELRVRSLVRGVKVLRGQAVDGGGLPLAVWRPIVRQLLLTVTVQPPEASILKELIADIELILGQAVANPPELVGQARQDRLFLTILNLLKRLTEPTMMILEDLQWIGDSLSLLKQVMNEAPLNPHIMIVGTYRNDERQDLPDVLTGFHLLTLDRLDRAEMSELSRAMIGDVGQRDDIVDLLATETEGNAYFIVEVMRTLAEEAGYLGAIGRTKLPHEILTGGMQSLLRRRIARLSDMYQPALQYAAIIGRQVDETLLKHLMPNIDIAAFLYEAEAAIVLNVENERWQFAHDKLRETTLIDVDGQQKPKLHQAVAQAIEKIYQDNKDYNEILFNHWHIAGHIEKEIYYLDQVIEYYIEISGDYNRANKLLNDFIDRSDIDEAQKYLLLNRQAQLLNRQGKYLDAMVSAEKAYQLADAQNDLVGCGTSLDHLGIAYEEQGKFDQALEYYTKALAVWEKVGDELRLAYTLNLRGGLAFYLKNFETAQLYYERAHTIRLKYPNKDLHAVGYNNLGVTAREQGNYTLATSYQQKSLELDLVSGNQIGLVSDWTNLGILALLMQDYTQATTYFYQALKLATSIGIIPYILEILANLAHVFLLQGRIEQSLLLWTLVDNHPAKGATARRALDAFYPVLIETVSEADLKTYIDSMVSPDLNTVVQGLLNELDSGLIDLST